MLLSTAQLLENLIQLRRNHGQILKRILQASASDPNNDNPLFRYWNADEGSTPLKTADRETYQVLSDSSTFFSDCKETLNIALKDVQCLVGMVGSYNRAN